MSGYQWERQTGDTAPDLVAILRERPADGQRVGAPADLTGATDVVVEFNRTPDGARLATVTGLLIDPAQGGVASPLPAEVTARPGLYAVTWTVHGTFGQRSFPVIRNADILRVTGEADTGSDGQAPAAAGSTGIYYYNESGELVLDPDARIIIRDDGDPIESNTNDLIIRRVT